MRAEQENQNKLVGERVKLIMERFGLTQKELGIRIGYGGDNPDRAINNIVHGRRELPPKKRDRINDEFDLNPDYLLLRSPYMTQKDVVQALVGQTQKADVMWTAFIKYISLRSGYAMKEGKGVHEQADGSFSIDLQAPYLIFENDSCSCDFTMRDINIYMEDITRYAELRLQIMIERKKGE